MNRATLQVSGKYSTLLIRSLCYSVYIRNTFYPAPMVERGSSMDVFILCNAINNYDYLSDG